jgi:hypothetical protein
MKLHIQLSRFNTRNLSSILFVGLLFVVLGAFSLQPLLAQAASSPLWSIVKSPNPSIAPLSNDTLFSVAAVSDTNAWAVGDFTNTNTNNIEHTLVEHWDGTAWSVIPSPNVGTTGSELLAVSTASPTDVWAVGSVTGSVANVDRTLIEHFNGSAWSVVPSPNLSQEGDNLTGVAAISATNVWAVGWFENDAETAILPLILHFDGTTWSAVPNIPTNSNTILLHGIAARSATDIWAVGETGNGPTNFALHFNGTQWSITPFAVFPSAGQQTLAGVASVSSTDVWAVGSFAPVNRSPLKTLAIHWNGTQWSKVTTPNVDAFLNRLFGVAAISSKDVWAVGQAVTPDGFGLHTLIEHWDGTQWSIVPSPNKLPQGNNANSILGVTVSGLTTLWAVGSFDSLVIGNPGLRTLTLHTNQG